MNDQHMTTSTRRLALQWYARSELTQENKAQALLNIVDKCLALAKETYEPPLYGGAEPWFQLIFADDLEAVMIGDSMRTGEGRNEGPFFVGSGYIQNGPSQGFKSQLHIDAAGHSDEGQVQHAAAAIVIAIRYGFPVELYAIKNEHADQDLRLYEAIFDIDFSWDLGGLTAALMHSICDGSCHLPPIGDGNDLVNEWNQRDSNTTEARPGLDLNEPSQISPEDQVRTDPAPLGFTADPPPDGQDSVHSSMADAQSSYGVLLPDANPALDISHDPSLNNTQPGWGVLLPNQDPPTYDPSVNDAQPNHGVLLPDANPALDISHDPSLNNTQPGWGVLLPNQDPPTVATDGSSSPSEPTPPQEIFTTADSADGSELSD
jgi:hypothetical protein